jgi:enolase
MNTAGAKSKLSRKISEAQFSADFNRDFPSDFSEQAKAQLQGLRLSNLWAREILDSRGSPTLEVEVCASNGLRERACVPSGASTGSFEAKELRDGDLSRFMGKGVLRAVKNAKEVIAPKILNRELSSLWRLDQELLDLDGTELKEKLGANAILGVSLAVTRLLAKAQGQSLFQHLANQYPYQGKEIRGARAALRLPVPLMNLINGGKHAESGLDVQEFMIVPLGFSRFREALRAGAEVFMQLKKVLAEKKLSTSVGDEGGFAPQLKSNAEALELLCLAIDKAGYRAGDQIALALDVASSEFYSEGFYHWEGRKILAEELKEIYLAWSNKFPIVSIEDAFSEEDWQGWAQATAALGDRLQLVGDDLFVTNYRRLARGVEIGAGNSILIKINQIGSIFETYKTIQLARRAGMTTVISHRSGETEDTSIADLAVGWGCEQIKTGSLARSERTAKYNQLLRIEEELGDRADFWGKEAL